jgi:hypothetical protein
MSESKLFKGARTVLVLIVIAVAAPSGATLRSRLVLCVTAKARGMALAAIYVPLTGNLLNQAGGPQDL